MAACSSSAFLLGFVLSDLLGVFVGSIIAWSLAPVNCEFMRGVRVKGIFKLASCLQNAEAWSIGNFFFYRELHTKVLTKARCMHDA